MRRSFLLRKFPAVTENQRDKGPDPLSRFSLIGVEFDERSDFDLKFAVTEHKALKRENVHRFRGLTQIPENH